MASETITDMVIKEMVMKLWLLVHRQTQHQLKYHGNKRSVSFYKTYKVIIKTVENKIVY